MDELLPALRAVDEHSLAVRSPLWAIYPRWDLNEFTFEYYGDEPDVYTAGDEKKQLVVTGVPWQDM